MGILDDVKKTIINQVIWAEKEFYGKSGKEKKAAVIKKLDDLIKLPSYLEWVDDMIISWLVDQVCEKLNAMTNKNFADLQLGNNDKEQLADSLEVKKHD